MASPEAEKNTTVDHPSIAIPPDPTPTAAKCCVKRRPTTVPPVQADQSTVSQTPTVPPLATVPSEPLPSYLLDTMSRMGKLHEAIQSLVVRFNESDEAGDTSMALDILSQIETLMDAATQQIDWCKQQLRDTRPVFKESNQILESLKIAEKAIAIMSKNHQRYRTQKGVLQDATVPPAPTIHPVPAVLPAPTVSRRMVVQSIAPLKKLVEIRKGVGSMETFYVEGLVTMSKEGEKREKKSRSAARKEKKWKEIFVPFDEEEGKLVEKLIERMMEVKPFVEKE